MTGYFSQEVKRQLRMLAAEEDKTIQQLLGESLNMLFARYGRAEIAPTERVGQGTSAPCSATIWVICGKRLKPLIPMLMTSMERHGHLALDPELRVRLAAISAATIDRALAPVRAEAPPRGRRRAAPSLAIRRSIPVRTFSDWGSPGVLM